MQRPHRRTHWPHTDGIEARGNIPESVWMGMRTYVRTRAFGTDPHAYPLPSVQMVGTDPPAYPLPGVQMAGEARPHHVEHL